MMHFKSVALASCVLAGLVVPTIAKAQSASKGAMSKSNAMAAPSKAMADSQQAAMPKHDSSMGKPSNSMSKSSSSMSKPSTSMSKPSKSVTPMQGAKPTHSMKKNQMSGMADSGMAKPMTKGDTAGGRMKKPIR
jgi:hypothetical protein